MTPQDLPGLIARTSQPRRTVRLFLRWVAQGCPRTLPVVMHRGTMRRNSEGGWTLSGWAFDGGMMRAGVVFDLDDLTRELVRRYAPEATARLYGVEQ